MCANCSTSETLLKRFLKWQQAYMTKLYVGLFVHLGLLARSDLDKFSHGLVAVLGQGVVFRARLTGN